MLALLLAASAIANAKYDDYIRAIESRPPAWVWSPKLRDGLVVATPANKAGDIDIGGALIHDWIGTVFIPGVRLAQVVAFLQDYDHQAKYYGPQVTDTHLLSREGDQWKIGYRLVQTKFAKVVYDVSQNVIWHVVSPAREYSTGVATRIHELSSKDHGYLWRLNTYWYLEEKDNGVYVESRSVSLSRTAPFGLGWLFNSITSSLPGESLVRQLSATRSAVRGR